MTIRSQTLADQPRPVRQHSGDQRAVHTPGPWDYVPSTEHHGPYVTSDFGTTICDCYVMSQPTMRSTASGGPSKPIHHLHEMADPNARLIAAAPVMLAALKGLLAWAEKQPTQYADDLLQRDARAAIAKAGGA